MSGLVKVRYCTSIQYPCASKGALDRWVVAVAGRPLDASCRNHPWAIWSRPPTRLGNASSEARNRSSSRHFAIRRGVATACSRVVASGVATSCERSLDCLRTRMSGCQISGKVLAVALGIECEGLRLTAVEWALSA